MKWISRLLLSSHSLHLLYPWYYMMITYWRHTNRIFFALFAGTIHITFENTKKFSIYRNALPFLLIPNIGRYSSNHVVIKIGNGTFRYLVCTASSNKRVCRRFFFVSQVYGISHILGLNVKLIHKAQIKLY